MKPDIAMCWDGQTPTAELIVDGVPLSGPPEDVQRIFDTLNRLRNDLLSDDMMINRLRTLVDEMRRELY